MELTELRGCDVLGLLMPKSEGMKIPRKMVERYGFGVFVNYPQDEFIEAYLDEFGEDEFVKKPLEKAR